MVEGHVMVHRNTLLQVNSLEGRLVPTAFYVNNLADSGPGSLRQAILDANANPGADTIQIQPGVNGQVMMSLGQMLVSDSLTINCPHRAILLNPNYSSRVFVANAALTLSGLELGYGLANTAPSTTSGGIIYSTAPLTIVDCDMEAGSAANGGAICQTGPSLAVSNSFFSDDATQGGGIWSTGTVSIQYTEFDSCRTNNPNSGGGGVYLANGSLTLDSDSFRGCGSNNTAYGSGGAVYANGTFFAQNCSFASNGANLGGAIYLTSGGTLWNCTVAYDVANGGQGGGIYGSVTLESTIVSNNTGSAGPDIFGAVTAKHCALGTSTGFNSYTDQGSNLAFGLNLQLEQGSFAHGGLVPVTDIQVTSPCKNQGSNPGGLLYDARGPGFPRMVYTAPDIGAYEIQTPPKVTVQLNDGSAQRSRITKLVVTFDNPNINFSSSLFNAFQLKRMSDNAVVTFSGAGSQVSNNLLTYNFGFSGGPLNSGSLADGVYVLTIFSAQITDEIGQHLDGNGDGIAGDNYVSPTTPGNPNRIFRLFGDADGSGTVDALDFGAFLGAFGTANSTFDFDNGGTVDALDFGQFLQRFGTGI
jgi:hypothetical protein